MTLDLSVKKVPEDVVERLRARAKRNHRSLQGELLVILEEAAGEPKLTWRGVYEEVERMGLRTPSESVRMVREDRDAR